MQSPTFKTVCFTFITWFCQNRLVINPVKSVVMLLSTTQYARASYSPLTDVNVSGCVVLLTDTVKLLGVTMTNRSIDHHLTLDSHVQNVSKSTYYHIWALKRICLSLYTDIARTIASALVYSRLEYTHSVLHSTSSGNMLELQRVQNSIAHVVTCEKTASFRKLIT